ncbi:GNAT family N-acetyltransferase [Austwickia chelonae]|uniref:GNAT family N-acetyltransferase n=1 Tax=Austwickia chelonae TaxID=100225 RepID=UPI001F073858|nr:GNAT family N-acetyltransferase [Austwickia chelonae]
MTDTYGSDTAGAQQATAVSVREARGDDLEAIRDLGLLAFPTTYRGIIEPELIQLLLAKWWTKDALVPIIRAGRAFVACLDGKVVGMCSYGPHSGAQVLWKLYVHPEMRGRGIASALLAAAEERATGSGMSLRISYTDGNRNAAAFCTRHGFVELSREEQVGMPELVWMGRPDAERKDHL